MVSQKKFSSYNTASSSNNNNNGGRGDPVTSQILKELKRLNEIRNDIDNKITSLQSLLNRHLINSSSTIDDLPTQFVSRELPYLSHHVLIQIPRDISRAKQLPWTTRSGVPRPKKNHDKGIRKIRKKKADKLCQLLQGLELKDSQPSSNTKLR
ncbi:hypothetical protein ACHQM5_027309 [Ranunculus cassubicifolius]